MPKTSWAVKSYQEESIVPQYLRQSDLSQSVGQKQSNFFESQLITQNDADHSPLLTMRNFVMANQVTRETASNFLNYERELQIEPNLVSKFPVIVAKTPLIFRCSSIVYLISV